MTSRDRVTAELQDRYEIQEVLGRGGTAVVYRARDLLLERPVAVKVLQATPAAGEDGQDRLLREAHTVAQLHHPNIVQLFDVRALDDDGLALIMQFVEGQTLKRLIASDGAFSCDVAGRILVDVAGALSYAHDRKLVHRDVKPDNVHYNAATGETHLSDFGIARRWGGASTLTLPGSALGTPAFMSPEQIDGRELDGRSDLYSLALLGYELLTGVSPWKGDTLFSILEEQKRRILPPLSEIRSDVPDHLADAIAVALRKDPEDRWPNTRAFAERILSGRLPSSPAPEKSGQPQVRLEDAPTVILRRGTNAESDSEPTAPPALSEPSPRPLDPSRFPTALTPSPPSKSPVPPSASSDPRSGAAGTPPAHRVSPTPKLDFSFAPPPPGEGQALPDGVEYYSPGARAAGAYVPRNMIIVHTQLDFARVIRYDVYQLLEDGDIRFEHGDCGGEMVLEPWAFTRTRRGKLKRVETKPDDEVALRCPSCEKRVGTTNREHFETALTRFLARPRPSAVKLYRLTESTSFVDPDWTPPRRRRRPDRRAQETRYEVDPSLMGRRRMARDRRREPDARDVPTGGAEQTEKDPPISPPEHTPAGPENE